MYLINRPQPELPPVTEVRADGGDMSRAGKRAWNGIVRAAEGERREETVAPGKYHSLRIKNLKNKVTIYCREPTIKREQSQGRKTRY